MKNENLTENTSQKKAKNKLNVTFAFNSNDEDVLQNEDLENEIAKKIFDVYLDETYKK